MPSRRENESVSRLRRSTRQITRIIRSETGAADLPLCVGCTRSLLNFRKNKRFFDKMKGDTQAILIGGSRCCASVKGSSMTCSDRSQLFEISPSMYATSLGAVCFT